MGAYMARHALVPDLIVASTAARVSETLQHVVPAFTKQPKVVSDRRLYEADPDDLLKLIKETPKTVHSLLLVGHNPGMAELASILVASGAASARVAAVAQVQPEPVARGRRRPGRHERR